MASSSLWGPGINPSFEPLSSRNGKSPSLNIRRQPAGPGQMKRGKDAVKVLPFLISNAEKIKLPLSWPYFPAAPGRGDGVQLLHLFGCERRQETGGDIGLHLFRIFGAGNDDQSRRIGQRELKGQLGEGPALGQGF